MSKPTTTVRTKRNYSHGVPHDPADVKGDMVQPDGSADQFVTMVRGGGICDTLRVHFRCFPHIIDIVSHYSFASPTVFLRSTWLHPAAILSEMRLSIVWLRRKEKI